MDDFSNRFKGFRIWFRLKQSDMADIMGVSEGQLRRYEQGKIFPPLDKLEPFVINYGLNLNWLLTGEGEMLIDRSHDQEVADLKAKVKRIEEEIDELAARRRSNPGLAPGKK